MNSSQNFLCWFEDEQNNYLSFPSKIRPCQLFQFKKQQKIFQQHSSNCKCFVTQFFWWFQSGNTCDETTGKETEFSLVVSFRNKYYLHSMCRDSAKLTNPRRRWRWWPWLASNLLSLANGTKKNISLWIQVETLSVG